MIKVKAKKRDIEETIWSVLTSFGFTEVEYSDNLKTEAKENKGKYCFFDNKKIGTLNSGEKNILSMAETAAACAEAAIAAGLDDTEILTDNDDVIEMLIFFGMEDFVDKDKDVSGFVLKCDDIIFARGGFSDIIECSIDVNSILELLEDSGFGISGQEAQASVIFAEQNAEGLAYDVAYNLRINGCIVEYFTEGGDISACEKYAEDRGISSIIRVFADGTTLIKDTLKNEIIETTVAEFLGYYADEEDECDCGCGHHHHGEDCNCQ